MSGLMNGARMLLECLVREGVECLFGYPGGVTLPFYDAMYDHPIRHVLVRHEQNAAFAAEGYARATGRVGVCCATSGPGATNLVTGLVDALMDSIPIVAITGQVSTKLIGSDAFQEADTFGITRSCTKHNYLVKNLNELPQIIHEAFYLASTGRPGPVLVDIPKDVFQGQAHYHPVSSIHLPGYKVYTEGHLGQIRRAAQMIWEAERPFVYAGGGVVASGAAAELREFVEIVDAPAVCTLMGLGALPGDHPNFISMPGMHGSYAANMGMYSTDLLIALGVRFDDRVTGRLSSFAPHAKVIHVDIDPSEIGKNRAADLPIVGDVKRVLAKLNPLLRELKPELGERKAAARRAWWRQIRAWQQEHPLEPAFSDTEIKPQHVMVEIDRLSRGKAIVTADVGQHQMWAAQFYPFKTPRSFLTSAGLGAMGFGFPAALGAKIAHPEREVIDIDGDGSFLMNIQELATAHIEGIAAKAIILNNQHLGMVVQWEDRFHGGNRAHTFLGDPRNPKRIYPDYIELCKGFGVECRRVIHKRDLRPALEWLLASKDVCVLDVMTPYTEHVLPMIPSGKTYKDIIIE